MAAARKAPTPRTDVLAAERAHCVVKRVQPTHPIDPRPPAAVWVGFIRATRRPCEDGLTSEDLFGPSMKKLHEGACWVGGGGCGCPLEVEDDPHYAADRGIGDVLAERDIAGLTFIREGFTEQELIAWYRSAMTAAVTCDVQAGPVGPTGWSSPLGRPSSVTSPFGVSRGDHAHEGEDLAAADGTPVIAPFKMQVIRILPNDVRGGLTVVANALRTEGPIAGTFPRDVGSYDDTGWVLTFSHLSRILPGVVAAENKGVMSGGIQPTPGSIIEQGAQFAESGHSGGNPATDGAASVFTPVPPHLHFQLQWFQDNALFDERQFVDPRILIPDDVISGRMAVAPPRGARVAESIVIPRGKPESDWGSRAVVINGNNNVIGQGTTVVSKVASDNKVVIPGLLSGGGEGPVQTYRIPTDGSPPVTTRGPPTGLPQFLPPTLWQAEDLQQLGGTILEGVGAYAGKAFEFATSPEAVLTLTKVGGAALSVSGGLISTAGGLVTVLGPVFGLINPSLAAAAEIIGPLTAASGVVGSSIGAASTGGGASLSQVFQQGPPGQGLPLPSNQAGPPSPLQQTLQRFY